MRKREKFSARPRSRGRDMRKVCLDTDFLVALLRNRLEAAKKAEEYDSLGVEASTTLMNAFEIYLGAFRSKEAEKTLSKLMTCSTR